MIFSHTKLTSYGLVTYNMYIIYIIYVYIYIHIWYDICICIYHIGCLWFCIISPYWLTHHEYHEYHGHQVSRLSVARILQGFSGFLQLHQRLCPEVWWLTDEVQAGLRLTRDVLTMVVSHSMTCFLDSPFTVLAVKYMHLFLCFNSCQSYFDGRTRKSTHLWSAPHLSSGFNDHPGYCT